MVTNDNWLPGYHGYICSYVYLCYHRYKGCQCSLVANGYANAPQAFHPIVISYLYITPIFAVVCTNSILFSIIWILMLFIKPKYDLQVPICETTKHHTHYGAHGQPSWLVFVRYTVWISSNMYTTRTVCWCHLLSVSPSKIMPGQCLN